MKSNSFIRVAALSFAILIMGVPVAVAFDTPLLTWERGKLQQVVLGQGSGNGTFQVKLVSSSENELLFNKSLKNAAGFIVYSLQLPKDLPTGSYRIVTVGLNGKKSIVAQVQITKLIKYEVTRFPSDLFYILTFSIFWLSLFTSVRIENKRSISLLTVSTLKQRYLAGEPAEEFIEQAHKIGKIEQKRIQFYELMSESFLKYALGGNSTGLHVFSTLIWAYLPIASICLGISTAFFQSNPEIISSSGNLLLMVVTGIFIGSTDLFSGFAFALPYFLIRIIKVQNLSVSSILLAFVASLLFFLPGLANEYYSLLFAAQKKDKGKNFKSVNFLRVIFLVSSTLFIILLSRSISGSTYTPYRCLVLFSLTCILGNSLNYFFNTFWLEKKSSLIKLEMFKINYGTTTSAKTAALISFLAFSVLYVWFEDFKSALLVASLFSIPLSFLYLKTSWAGLNWGSKLPRNAFIEISSVLVATSLVFFIVTKLPFLNQTSAKLYLVFGILPSILYSIYAFVADRDSEVEMKQL